MRMILVVSLLVLLVSFGFRQSTADSGAQKAALSAAQTWLVLQDRGNYSAAWKEASGHFRGTVTERNWLAAMEKVRKPLGKLVSRTLAKSEVSRKHPGAPEGYVVVWFRTSFERKKTASEIVAFTLDNDGKWRAAGYLIK